MITVAVANQKGGVGKTTTAVTLAHALATRGRSVLLADLDPQGHVAYSLGLDPEPALYRLLVDGAPLATVTTSARPGLDAVLGDRQTETAKRIISAGEFSEFAITEALEGAAYEVCFLDLAPSLDVLHVAALVAADFAIIPTKLDALATFGVRDLLRTVKRVTQAGYPLGRGFCVLPCFFDRQTKETAAQLKELVTAFKAANIWPPIPQDTKAREATAYGLTLWEYAPTTPALLGYQKNGHRVGGYVAAVDRLLGVLSG